MTFHQSLLLVIAAGFLSCNSPNDTSQKPATVQVDKRRIDTLIQLELADSSKLIHIKGLFYKNQTGHLYHRTFANREINDSLVFVEYFNGQLPQDIDPLSFAVFDGWFAKDKNSVYYYRPTSGGMLISKMEKADSKSFAVLKGHYLFAIDKKHVFKESEILDNLNPSSLEIINDKDGNIIGLKSGDAIYMKD